MSDHDNFLSRWSRRKRGSDADKPPIEKSGEPSDGRAALPQDQTRHVIPKDDAGAPAFDVTSLPPIESIEAGTDLSAFMQKGVPAALRHAALRRAWTADPAIRDHMGLTENFWDAAGPDGVMGFGELDPGIDVNRMVSELFGETTADKSGPEQHDSANVPEQLEKNSKVPGDPGRTAGVPPLQSAPQKDENGATQKRVAQEPSMQKITRRHGGAMPE
jgi:uncharacterized protein DUF3306